MAGLHAETGHRMWLSDLGERVGVRVAVVHGVEDAVEVGVGRGPVDLAVLSEGRYRLACICVDRDQSLSRSEKDPRRYDAVPGPE